MDDATRNERSPQEAAALDPRTGDPRELMRALLPAARRNYVKAWELLADASTLLDRRRAARERAAAIAADHAIVAQALREREPSLQGDDLLNARHLAGELERHASALERLAGVSPHGLQASADLRPEALGCGRHYRDPARKADEASERRGAGAKAKRDDRGARDRGQKDDPTKRSSKRPFDDRGPKAPRDALGTSKHDSSLGDDLDEATRAKLEALRAQLEG